MKKFLFLCLMLLLTTTSAYAGDKCGKIAGYDDRGRAMYYDDCDPIDAMTPVTTNDAKLFGEGTLLSGTTEKSSCDGVSCPSDMTLGTDCCCILK